jgi:cell division protein FtsA
MAASNVRENLIRCVQKADVEVDDLVLSPLASAEAVLTEQEKNLGVALVDIGHGTTDIAIYIEGSVWHTKIIPVGGWQLTNDLAIVFNIPYEAAEPLKLQYGQAVAPGTTMYARTRSDQPINGKSHPAGAHAAARSALGGQSARPLPIQGVSHEHGHYEAYDPGHMDEVLEAQTFEGSMRFISRGELNEVMAARFDQMFGMIADEIRRSGYEGLLPAGVVLTGGVAATQGIEDLAIHKLHMPVRIGRPQSIGGLADAFDSPAYAASAGLTLWGLKQGQHPNGAHTPRTQRAYNGQEAKGLLAKWLKGFLPQG